MSEFSKIFDSASILVIGGAGFVGSNLVKLLLSSSATVHIMVIDNLLSAERSNVPSDSRVQFIEGSISDDKVLKQLDDRFDYIFHLATYHGNQSSIHDPIADHENNTLTTVKLFNTIKDFKRLKKVVYSGAGCAVAEKTFDVAQATPEQDVVSLDMDSPYSISKISGEFYSKYYFKQHGLPIVRARFQNAYGPGEILGAGKWRGTPATVWRNVTPTFIYKSMKKKALPLENGGNASRDFIYVEDIVRGLIYCAWKGAPGDVYNLASGKETFIIDLAKAINQLTQNSTPIELLPKRNWDNSGTRFGCPEKSKKQLGFVAKTDLLEGLKKTVQWTTDNLELIERTMNKHKDKVPL